MDQASPQCIDDDSSFVAHQTDERLPAIVVHVAVMPGATLSWRIHANSTLAVRGARVWLTRVHSPYDYWLTPGAEIRLQRGERVWLSTDGREPAHVSLTSTLPVRRGLSGRWFGWLGWLTGLRTGGVSTPR